MDNKGVAAIFEEMSNILDIAGANFFRVNAYKKASLTILNMAEDLREIVKRNPDELLAIPGIGKDLKNKIVELVLSGKCEEHERMKKSIPEGLLQMLELRGVGPKKVKALYLNLAVKNIEELKKAAEKGLIRSLPKMGEKTEQEILKAIKEHSMFSTKRFMINEALIEANRLVSYMEKCPEIKKIQYAGSLRRRQETIGDIDILTTVADPVESHEEVMEHFVNYDEVLNISARGDTRSAILLKSGINVDLRVIEDKSFGAALHYFTGSKEHNVRIRDIAKKDGLKISEYGVFKGEKMIGGKTEEEVFASVGLPFIIPEIRKNEGEFEYAMKHKKMPDFIELEDIRGDLHNHSVYSDGKNTIEEMAEVFIKGGYEYFAMTDHSKVVGVTGGMDKKKIMEQWKEIDVLNKKLKGKIRILKGCEVDILKDGALDFEDEVLKNLDVVVISAHLHGRLPAEEQTRRLIRAIENSYSMILGHPTGRLINKRSPMEFDMAKVIDACVANKVAMEINSNPMRLDISDKYVKMAKDKGAKFVIDTDSHEVSHPAFMEFGVGIARRGWLTKKDVLNAWSLKEFDSYF
ncbi:DNA polymerase/3'-5' exonuclease PolX [Candidatus Peregrinibacteria bacterium]|nr:DNA polymerase/3'-5' exonuclease PolX [Candidatus Peregrinibacteria bacterium]